MTFTEWLDTLIEEKGIDTDMPFEIDTPDAWHLMPYGVVIEAIKTAPAHEQAAIKTMLVKIDFANGDIKHYLRHLAQALVNPGRQIKITGVTASQCHTRTRLSRYSPHTCPHCGTSELVGTHGRSGWQLIDFGWVDFTNCESPLIDNRDLDDIPF